MTGRPPCSQHETPGESGAPSRCRGAGVCPFPMSIVLSYLTYWVQRSSSQARLPGGARSLGASGLQRAGQVLSPIYRTGRGDVPLRSAGLRASGLADRLPLVTARPGPGGRLRNVARPGLSAPASTPIAEYLRLSRPTETLWTLRQIFQFCASRPALAARALLYGRLTSSRGSRARR
jgi:hypothetical protein